MRALVQRVLWARVRVGGDVIGEIPEGLAVLLGVGAHDTDEDASKLAAKIRKMRIFADAEGRMNRSIEDIEGEMLVVSQFTLYADTSSGNRPGFGPAAPPEKANRLYRAFVGHVARAGIRTSEGEFGADMRVEFCNDGPVTIWLDTAAP